MSHEQVTVAEEEYLQIMYWLQEAGLPGEAVAYIGDDVNDLGVLARQFEAALTGAPADAAADVLPYAHYRCAARGGHGAFREFAEWILRLRGAVFEEGMAP